MKSINYQRKINSQRKDELICCLKKRWHVWMSCHLHDVFWSLRDSTTRKYVHELSYHRQRVQLRRIDPINLSLDVFFSSFNFANTSEKSSTTQVVMKIQCLIPQCSVLRVHGILSSSIFSVSKNCKFDEWIESSASSVCNDSIDRFRHVFQDTDESMKSFVSWKGLAKSSLNGWSDFLRN